MSLKFRKALMKDAEMLLLWRNDKDTRANSFNSDEIKLEDHLKWLQKFLIDKDRYLLIVEDKNTPIGVVRFDRKDKNFFELSWTVAPEVRGRGYGKKMVSGAVLLPVSNGQKILAQIKKENVASQKIAVAAGFVLDSEDEKGNQKWFKDGSQKNKMKILFLGYVENPVVDFLRKEGNEVVNVAPEEKISLDKIKEINPDQVISFGYRKIIKQDVLDAYPEIINLHISYLPWNKGCDPNFWSFLENTPKGYSIQYMNADPIGGIDTGAIIIQEKAKFDGKETLASSYNKLRNGIENLFIKNWDKIREKKLKTIPQNPNEGNYHHLHDIDKYKFLFEKSGWETPAAEIAEYGKKNDLWIVQKKK